jgi:FtsP/CotA-like multicopper oxidase with cupredoxin domain
VTGLRLAAALVVLLAADACAYSGQGSTGPALPPIGPSGGASAPAPGGAIRHFDLTAAPLALQLGPGVKAQAWAYNGQVPGPALRVVEGDLVVVTLHNRLPEGTSIHWHGLAVPTGQDGVAGVTQDATPPGATATYSFVATTAGTYWYHAHQDSAAQVGRGLYGPLIVDPPGADAAQVADRTLMYAEFPLGLLGSQVPKAGDPLLITYTTYSVNGRTGTAIEPVSWRLGQTVRLRLVDAGNLVHFLRLDGIPYRVVAFDGHAVTGGPVITDVLAIGPGERIDIEFEGPASSSWLRMLDSTPPAEQVGVPLQPVGSRPPPAAAPAPVRDSILDPFTYPAVAVAPGAVPTSLAPTRSYTVTLTTTAMPRMPGMPRSPDGLAYQLNGARFPETATLEVRTGDVVWLTFVNQSRTDHPIHFHGHVFTLVARSGSPAIGVIVKDTVVVRPGASVTVAFRADNPGWWMLHCHELYHAASGMMMLVRYADTPRLANLDGPYHSRPD